jgi:hypothetical protein
MDWEVIDAFPDYSVSSSGQIRNDETGRILVLTRNQRGIIIVGLMRNGIQHKRAVALLVANAFLPPPTPSTFDTPIHLDGDLSNNNIENLMWRPRWFAIRYHKQFHTPRTGRSNPVQETQTGQFFNDSWEAATRYGLLDKEILMAITNRTYVWPTYQLFKAVPQE